MKLFIVAAIIALTICAPLDASHVGGKWAGSIQKFDGKFTCQLTMTISGHTVTGDKTAPSTTTASDKVYLVASEKQAGATLANGDTIFACGLSKAAVGGKWKFDGKTMGTCANYTMTALKPASPKAWAADKYDFNCTNAEAGTDNLNAAKCFLSYDMGELEVTKLTDVKKTGVQVLIAANTLTANWVNAASTADATISEVADKKCETKSSAVTTMFAGALALAGAAFF